MITLTQEQARLLTETSESPPAVLDPNTQRTYFLVWGDVYARAQALIEEEQDVVGKTSVVCRNNVLSCNFVS